MRFTGRSLVGSEKGSLSFNRVLGKFWPEVWFPWPRERNRGFFPSFGGSPPGFGDEGFGNTFGPFGRRPFFPLEGLFPFGGTLFKGGFISGRV